MKWILGLTPLLLAPIVVQSQDHGLLSIHGSGTTNPQKCYWLIMSQFMEQAKTAIRMTYRAVGSTTGKDEFIAEENGYTVPFNDFGSGDIPVPSADYQALTAAGQEMVHIPILLGAISIFHNIPGIPSGPEGLHLTPCVIAKIFNRKITIWDDQEILDLNPGLREKLPSSSYPIYVARRVEGSSSTASITAYLHKTCETEWPVEQVGSKITWPDDTMKCDGSGEMTNCIRDNPGTIGYIDSGHGHAEDLTEIELRNNAGNFLSSREAGSAGIGAAAVSIPASPDADFGDVNLLDQPGENTWPVVTMTYIYARKDLSFFRQPAEKSLFVAFLRSLYNETYIGQCEQFGFTLVPESIRNIGQAGIDMLEVDTPNATVPTWTFELETNPGPGQGDYVISSRRRTYAEYQLSSTTEDVEDLLQQVADLRRQIEAVNSYQAASVNEDDFREFTEDDERQLKAALALASLSFAFWIIALTVIFVKRCFKI